MDGPSPRMVGVTKECILAAQRSADAKHNLDSLATHFRILQSHQRVVTAQLAKLLDVRLNDGLTTEEYPIKNRDQDWSSKTCI